MIAFLTTKSIAGHVPCAKQGLLDTPISTSRSCAAPTMVPLPLPRVLRVVADLACADLTKHGFWRSQSLHHASTEQHPAAQPCNQ